MIEVADCVRFKRIPEPFITLAAEIETVCLETGDNVYITGASFEDYPEGSYHDQGYAWDFRIWNLHSPIRFISLLYSRLYKLDPRWRVLYGDAGHTDHFHVEFQYDKRIDIQ